MAKVNYNNSISPAAQALVEAEESTMPLIDSEAHEYNEGAVSIIPSDIEARFLAMEALIQQQQQKIDQQEAMLSAKDAARTSGKPYNCMFKTDDESVYLNLPAQLVITKDGSCTVNLKNGKFNAGFVFTAEQRSTFWAFVTAVVGGPLKDKLDDLRKEARLNPWTPKSGVGADKAKPVKETVKL